MTGYISCSTSSVCIKSSALCHQHSSCWCTCCEVKCTHLVCQAEARLQESLHRHQAAEAALPSRLRAPGCRCPAPARPPRVRGPASRRLWCPTSSGACASALPAWRLLPAARWARQQVLALRPALQPHLPLAWRPLRAAPAPGPRARAALPAARAPRPGRGPRLRA